MSNKKSGKKSDKVIVPDSPESASRKNVEGWVSRKGRFFGENEGAARYDGATHKKCFIEGCENLIPISSYLLSCDSCRDIIRNKIYQDYPVIDWDEKTPLCLFDDDRYFTSVEEIEEYCYEHELEIEDLKLVLCKPIEYPRIDVDSLFEGTLGCDDDPSDEVIDAIERLNKEIDLMSPSLWCGSEVAVRISVRV